MLAAWIFQPYYEESESGQVVIMGRGYRRVGLYLAAAGCISGCGGGTELVRPLPRASAELIVKVIPHSEDAGVAQQLGWSGGIPDADVVLTPADSSSPSDTARTDATGRAEFGSLPTGDYLVQVHRWLSPEERAMLAPAESVNGWVGGGRITASGTGGPHTMTALASRRQSLVINEWAFNDRWLAGFGNYPYGGYLELYNNADTTVYLDGIVIAEVVHGAVGESCTLFSKFNNDPLGVWVTWFQQLPGKGSEYPAAPGQKVRIATDAIDHRPIFPGALDLTSADFEFSGSRGADNPAVPNAIDIGFLARDHGLTFAGLNPVIAIAKPFSLAGMARDVWPNGYPAGRIPITDLLDVLSIGASYPPAIAVECPRLVSPAIDRDPSRVRGAASYEEYEYSLVRRSTSLSNADRSVLQHTRSSALDFVRSPRTRGGQP
jgi:hypothetical protein